MRAGRVRLPVRAETRPRGHSAGPSARTVSGRARLGSATVPTRAAPACRPHRPAVPHVRRKRHRACGSAAQTPACVARCAGMEPPVTNATPGVRKHRAIARTLSLPPVGRSCVHARPTAPRPRDSAPWTPCGAFGARCPAERDSAVRHPPPTAARTHARTRRKRHSPCGSAAHSAGPCRFRRSVVRSRARPRSSTPRLGAADTVRAVRRAGCPSERDSAVRHPPPAAARTHPTKATQPVRKRRALPPPVSLDARAWSRPRPKRHRACGSAARSHRRCRFRRSVGRAHGPRPASPQPPPRPRLGTADTLRGVRRARCPAGRDSAARSAPRRAAPTARTRPGRARPRRLRS